MPVLKPYRGDYYLWNYIPSIAASVIFTLLFIGATSAHFWRQFKTRSKFCWPFSLGCLFEVIGYAGRATAANKTEKLMPYVIQSFFLLVAPALFAASIYMTLGRIIRCVKGEHHSIIRINWLTKVFVTSDVLSFMVQGGSSGLMFNESTAHIGEMVVLVGLFIQIIAFGLFFICAVIFKRRMDARPTLESYIATAPWKQTLYMLYTVSILIFVRSIFRVVEYIQGQQGYSMKHEWTLYIFDSIPMFVVAVVFFIYYPSTLQRASAEDIPINEYTGSNNVQDGKASYQSQVQRYMSA
ncbi:RTA1 like protein [Phlyctema vagabunda]|uniref:RTA1 like protein n=1 Tax=Phlyctema vagabunda TaxID=108571 RepID=A0ABR4PI87_9HELO